MHSIILLVIFLLGVITFSRYKMKKEFDINSLLSSKNKYFTNRLSKILYAFLFGFKTSFTSMLGTQSVDKLIESNLPILYRGFAFEGVSMSTFIFSLFKKGSFHRLLERNEGFIYQLFVGYGWGLHTLFGFSKRSYRFFEKRLDSKYSPIIYDGVGFKIGLFNYKKNKNIIKRFSSYNEDNERTFYQGIGRSLWFLSEFNLNTSLEMALEISTKYSRDIISGIGIAYSYSLFDELATNFKNARHIPKPFKQYNRAFLQGVAFGIYARNKQHPEYAESVIKKLGLEEQVIIRDWIKLIDQTSFNLSQTLPQEFKNQYFYFLWIDRIRDNIRSRR